MRGNSPSPSAGPPASPVLAGSAQDILARLLSAPPEASQFAPAFLAAIPFSQLSALLADLRNTVGAPLDIRAISEKMVITTATHHLRVRIALDSAGRVNLLFFQEPEPRLASLDAALDGIRALGSDTAWLVVRGGMTLASEGASRPLAVGSAFKLGVLAVLAQDVLSGLRRWEDVVFLHAVDQSLPTGILQDYPPGVPLTLHTAAALMISVSDNTATDLLIRTLGRDRVADALGLDTLLTTREFFALKGDPIVAREYIAAPPSERAALAAKAASELPSVSQVSGHHVAGIEWYLPLDRLCALAAPLADLPLMAINPGPVPAEDWARIAYKGGSELGVLNFTALLQDSTGCNICVAITVNSDKDIDLSTATSAFRALLAVLRSPADRVE